MSDTLSGHETAVRPRRGRHPVTGRQAPYALQAACSCGWYGPERYLTEGLPFSSRRRADDDVRRHIESLSEEEA